MDTDDPTNSMKLTPLDSTRDEISSDSQLASTTGNEAHDFIASRSSDSDPQAARSISPRSEDHDHGEVGEDLSEIRAGVYRNLTREDFELTEEDFELLENFHEEMLDSDFITFDIGEL